MAHVEVERRRDDDQAGKDSGLPSPEEPSDRDHARDAGHGRDERGDRGAHLRHAAEGDRCRSHGPEEELGLVEVVLAAELGDEPPAVVEGVLRQERESRLIRRPERAASRRGGDDHHGEDEHAENACARTPQNTAHRSPGYTRSSRVLYARGDRPPLTRRRGVAKFKVVTPAGIGYGAAGYALEMEALAPLGAEIVEIEAKTDDDFVKAARDADALYAKGRHITRPIVDGLERCRVIALGSVGVDSVDVAAATARGIPVTNVPDTFIEEVADHAMTLILATYRRVTTMDRMVREGRWAEGRPMLSQFPRLMGQTLGLIAFGHVARGVATRAKPFGLRVIAFDPFVEELTMSRYGVEPVSLPELLAQADIVSMHAPSTPSAQHMLREEHFRAMKRTALFVNTGRGPTVDEPALIKALQEGWIAGAGLDVLEEEPVTPSNPLLKMDNVTLPPYVASASARFHPLQLRG